MTDVIDTNAVIEAPLKKESITFTFGDHVAILQFHYDDATNMWYCYMTEEVFEDMKAAIEATHKPEEQDNGTQE
jgi:hypothetical protein